MSLKHDLARVERNVQSIQSALQNLELGFTHHTRTQPNVKAEPNLFRLIRQQRKRAAREYYLKNAGRITDEWQLTNKPCSHFPDCNHNQVKFKGKDGRWYIICPVKYYLLLGSRALWESREIPPRELFWQLQGKEMPKGEEKRT